MDLRERVVVLPVPGNGLFRTRLPRFRDAAHAQSCALRTRRTVATRIGRTCRLSGIRRRRVLAPEPCPLRTLDGILGPQGPGSHVGFELERLPHSRALTDTKDGP